MGSLINQGVGTQKVRRVRRASFCILLPSGEAGRVCDSEASARAGHQRVASRGRPPPAPRLLSQNAASAPPSRMRLRPPTTRCPGVPGSGLCFRTGDVVQVSRFYTCVPPTPTLFLWRRRPFLWTAKRLRKDHSYIRRRACERRFSKMVNSYYMKRPGQHPLQDRTDSGIIGPVCNVGTGGLLQRHAQDRGDTVQRPHLTASSPWDG